MKKTVLYIFILLVLLLGVYFLFFYDSTPTDEQERDFAVKKPETLSKIHIKDREGNEIYLTKKERKWYVNDTYLPKETMLKDLMKAITSMESVSAVSKAAHGNVMQQMLSQSFKVSLYKKGKKKPFKVYHVGGANHTQDGTHVLMEINGKAASQAYVAHIPGRRGYFTYVFTPQLSEWRSLEYTQLLPQEIKNISVTYLEPELKHQSFAVERNKGNYTLNISGKSIPNDEINGSKVEALFSSFTDLHYETFQDNYIYKDSIITNYPFATIALKTVDGDEEFLKVYRMPLSYGDRMITQEGRSNEYNIERLFALNEKTGAFTTIQTYTFRHIFILADELITAKQQDE